MSSLSAKDLKESLGDDYEIQIAESAYGALPTWYTIQVERNHYLKLQSLPAASAIGVPLEEDAIVEGINLRLGQKVTKGEPSQLSSLVETSSFVLEAAIDIDSDKFKKLAIAVLSSDESIDWSRINFLFDNDVLSVEDGMDIMNAAPSINSHILDFVLKREPWKAGQLILDLEDKLDSMSLHQIFDGLSSLEHADLPVAMAPDLKGILIRELREWVM